MLSIFSSIVLVNTIPYFCKSSRLRQWLSQILLLRARRERKREGERERERERERESGNDNSVFLPFLPPHFNTFFAPPRKDRGPERGINKFPPAGRRAGKLYTETARLFRIQVPKRQTR